MDYLNKGKQELKKNRAKPSHQDPAGFVFQEDGSRRKEENTGELVPRTGLNWRKVKKDESGK